MDLNEVVAIIWKFMTNSIVVMFVVQAIKAFWKNRPPNASRFIALGLSLIMAGYLAYSTPVAVGVEVWVHWLTYLLAGAVVGTGSAIGLFEGASAIVSKGIDKNLEKAIAEENNGTPPANTTP